MCVVWLTNQNHLYCLNNTFLSFENSSKYKFIYLQRDLVSNKFNVLLSLSVDDFAPDDKELGVRELILKDLEKFIKRQFPGNSFFIIESGFNFLKCNCITFLPKLFTNRTFFFNYSLTAARLQLFGSSKNGFGFRQSDLDICMILEGQETLNASYWLIALWLLIVVQAPVRE